MVSIELYNMPVSSTKLVGLLLIIMLLAYPNMSGISQTLTPDGRVTHTYSDGSKYEGEWKNAPHGRGIYLFADGSKYDGEWKNGKFDGKGTYYYKNGSKYDGEWKNSMQHGKGTYYWNGGDVYSGEWKHGRKHGSGTYRSADGREYSGAWLNDEPVKNKSTSAGRNSVISKGSGVASANGTGAVAAVRWRLDSIFHTFRQDYASANTAQDADYLTDVEKDAICYLNIVRMNPSLFADTYVRHYGGIPNYARLYAFDERKQSLISELKRLKPLEALYPDREIHEYAACFARESGRRGTVGHGRNGTGCESNVYAECCSYGLNDGLLIILELLIDAGENNAALGHRKLCLGQYGMAGLSVQSHATEKYVCVLNFGYNPDNIYTVGLYTGHLNVRGEYHGTGTYRYANGDVYSGEWERGMKHGAGTYRWADGTVYEGLWKNNSYVK
jgi:hypothetical protein